MEKSRTSTERGSALLIAMLVMVILTLMGLSYLFLADTENLIAQNQRDSDQLLFVGEAGARMVKAWFDRPAFGPPSDPNAVLFRFLNTFDLRNSAYFDRTQRLLDHDNDPNTPDVLADGSSGKPYHRQGWTVDPNAPAYLSFFDHPYRGGLEVPFLGSETGPDLILQSNSLDPNTSGSVDILDQINAAMFTDQPNTGRIQRIELYRPPILMVNGIPQRYGIATVKVTASKFRHMAKVGATWVTTPDSRRTAERLIKMVLNEVPYPLPGGPLQSCTGVSTNGAFSVHWGPTTAVDDASISTSEAQLQSRAPESIPWENQYGYISGADLTAYIAAREGDPSAQIADPWFQLITGGTFNPPLDPNAAPGDQIIPYPYNPATPTVDDNSNVFQHSDAPCPEFEYNIWKQVAQTGSGNSHFLVWTGSGDNFQENGTGPTKSFAEWTGNITGGLYFFDTADGQPPELDGSNLTDDVFLTSSDDWAGGGFIYLNAQAVRQTGIDADAIDRVLFPPGEPYIDTNGNNRWDSGEPYVNLNYPTAASGTFEIDPNAPDETNTETSVTGEDFTHTTTTARDPQGLPILEEVNWSGVIYTSGTWDAQGNGKFYGSIVTRLGVISSAGTPDIWFDEKLIKDEWPPADLHIPRTMITFWQTDL